MMLIRTPLLDTRTTSALSLSLFLALPSSALAASQLDQVVDLCKTGLSGENLAQAGKAKSIHKSPDAGLNEYWFSSEVSGQPVEIRMGLQFGKLFCEVNLPNSGTDDFMSARKVLLKQVGSKGQSWQQPGPYLHQAWSDSKALGNGDTENLTVGGIKLRYLQLQYATKADRRSKQRTGMIYQFVIR